METETEADKGVTIRLSGRVERRSIYGNGKRRGSVYDAKCGPVEVSADTRAGAVAELMKATAAMLDGYGNPVILWSLDGREAWIAFHTPSGWGYAINDATRQHNSRMGSMIYPNGGISTREECLERMRSHWYDLNARAIVDGIMGLCTDMRLWECPKCRTVQRSHAPYKCKNPACGADAPAFDW